MVETGMGGAGLGNGGFDGPAAGAGYGPPGRERAVKQLLGKIPMRLAFLALVLLWLASGVYIVEPDQQGVVRRFGRHVATTGPGIHYRLPYPVERVDTVTVTGVRRIELGFRTVNPGPAPQYRAVPEESLMLTGDENIVIAEVIVQYRLKDAADYLFRLAEPDEAVRAAAQAALRQVVGSHAIDDVLTTGKAEIQEQVRELVQQILDDYESGMQVVAVQLQDVHPPDPVVAAFKDVASAREDQVKIINEAESYANDVVPRARGEAEAMIEQAEGYKAARIARAQGDAERFRLLVESYQQGPEVTRIRMYLEALEAILPGMRKVILDEGGAGDGNLLKLLDLTSLAGGAAGGAAGGGQSPGTSGSGAGSTPPGAGTAGSGVAGSGAPATSRGGGNR